MNNFLIIVGTRQSIVKLNFDILWSDSRGKVIGSDLVGWNFQFRVEKASTLTCSYLLGSTEVVNWVRRNLPLIN